MPLDAPLIVLAMIAARVAGLATCAPGWGTPGLEARLRLALIALVTLVLAPAVGPTVQAPATTTALGLALVVEAGLGASLGFGLALVVASARQAGEMIGLQAGLTPAAVMDPDAGEGLTPIGHLYGLIALGAFLALDGPLQLVLGLLGSYRAFPAGSGLELLSEATVTAAFVRVGLALAATLQAAAPVALALLTASVAMGLVARLGGSSPLGGLAWPARAALAIVLVGLGLTMLAAWAGRTWLAAMSGGP
jgi:flagellar biosynthetic protein FliR